MHVGYDDHANVSRRDGGQKFGTQLRLPLLRGRTDADRGLLPSAHDARKLQNLSPKGQLFSFMTTRMYALPSLPTRSYYFYHRLDTPGDCNGVQVIRTTSLESNQRLYSLHGCITGVAWWEIRSIWRLHSLSPSLLFRLVYFAQLKFCRLSTLSFLPGVRSLWVARRWRQEKVFLRRTYLAGDRHF